MFFMVAHQLYDHKSCPCRAWSLHLYCQYSCPILWGPTKATKSGTYTFPTVEAHSTNSDRRFSNN